MINTDEPGIIKVNSFTAESDNVYTITVDEEQNIMTNCNCLAYTTSSTICKHMFLANLHARIGFPDCSLPVLEPITAIQPRIEESPDQTHANNQAKLARAKTILTTNNTRLQDLLNADVRYDEHASAEIEHAAELLSNVWSLLKDAEYPMSQPNHHQRRI
ncbi:hypothetical protein BC941DRAFT_489175 [Chlamydoabsidia padenii]|nr:hypothetical protein BC941DRAFT_489175 [Chlamydoabsidia padenii]